jgi:hypothetical protein
MLDQNTLDWSKGRKIFGGLEDFGKVWRTGANSNKTYLLNRFHDK